jgi:sugar phosphate isomerase/epimerase
MLPRFTGTMFFLCACALTRAGDAPLYVFDNGTGRGTLSIEEQAELTRKTGYAGIFYSGTENIPQLLEAHRKRGLKVLGIYTGMNISDAKPGFEPGLPEAIRQLKGTGALVAFTINGKGAKSDGDGIAIAVLRDVADMAAEAGLKVALYPHYGFHVARIEDALRVREKAGRPNIGIVFNLCHWLRSGDEANMAARLRESLPYTLMVSINGADHEGDWDRLIQTLDGGSFDVRSFVKTLGSMGYRGPIGLQCYNVKGNPEENLRRSMTAWGTF